MTNSVSSGASFFHFFSYDSIGCAWPSISALASVLARSSTKLVIVIAPSR
jgi:hypothetical protein